MITDALLMPTAEQMRISEAVGKLLMNARRLSARRIACLLMNTADVRRIFGGVVHMEIHAVPVVTRTDVPKGNIYAHVYGDELAPAPGSFVN